MQERKELKEAAGREQETVTTSEDVLRDEEDLDSNTDQPSEPPPKKFKHHLRVSALLEQQDRKI